MTPPRSEAGEARVQRSERVHKLGEVIRPYFGRPVTVSYEEEPGVGGQRQIENLQERLHLVPERITSEPIKVQFEDGQNPEIVNARVIAEATDLKALHSMLMIDTDGRVVRREGIRLYKLRVELQSRPKHLFSDNDEIAICQVQRHDGEFAWCNGANDRPVFDFEHTQHDKNWENGRRLPLRVPLGKLPNLGFVFNMLPVVGSRR